MKKISLACTGGGIKACANIGVIRALEELGIKIEAISGASLGSLVSFLYAVGYSPKEMLDIFEKEILEFQKFSPLEILLAIPNFFVNGGVKKVDVVVDFVKKIEKEKDIKLMSEIDIPLIIPAMDLSFRELSYYSSVELKKETHKVFTKRSASEAISCSCALPVLFIPKKVYINNVHHYMLDGGIPANTLVTPLKEFKYPIVGITNKYYAKNRKHINLVTGFMETFQSMRRTYIHNELNQADILIEIDCKTNKFFGTHEEIRKYEQLGYDTIMKNKERFI